jgi:hypothetical protein
MIERYLIFFVSDAGARQNPTIRITSISAAVSVRCVGHVNDHGRELQWHTTLARRRLHKSF